MNKTTTISIIIFISLILVLGSVLYLKANNNNNSHINTTSSISQSNNSIQNTDSNKLVAQIVASQGKFISNLFPTNKTFEFTSRFVDIYAPLGAIDPIANPNGDKNINVIQNVSAGFFGTKYGFTSEKVKDLVTFSLNYGLKDFKFTEYFKENNSTLNKINSDFNHMDNIDIIAYWSSGMTRVNNIFYDKVQGNIWQLTDINNSYYNFDNIKVYDIDTGAEKIPELNKLDSNKIGILMKNMSSVYLTTIYRCNDKNIYIIGGMVDNAYGFIEGAESAEEINCGLLKGRFKVIKDVKLDGNWRFWVGN